MYVSRNTISNWECGRTYPDLQSLLLLGVLFDTSLDTLVKGDVDVMEEKLAADRKRFNRLAYAMAIGLGMVIILAIPLTWKFGWLGLSAVVLIWAVTFAITCRVERMKKDADLVTFEEIQAFMEGREIERDSQVRTPRGRRVLMLRTVGTAIALAAIAFVIFYVACALFNVPRW